MSFYWKPIIALTAITIISGYWYHRRALNSKEQNIKEHIPSSKTKPFTKTKIRPIPEDNNADNKYNAFIQKVDNIPEFLHKKKETPEDPIEILRKNSIRYTEFINSIR